MTLLLIIIFPSHYFIPVHYVGLVYEGNDKVYAKQLFGSTNYSYTKPKTNFIQKLLTRAERKKRKKLKKIIVMVLLKLYVLL